MEVEIFDLASEGILRILGIVTVDTINLVTKSKVQCSRRTPYMFIVNVYSLVEVEFQQNSFVLLDVAHLYTTDTSSLISML